MGSLRFRPASIFSKPRSFGRVEGIWFVETPDLNPGERLWAIYQHQMAVAVFETLKTKGMSLNVFAEELGEDDDWLMRKLYGRAPADLGEMLTWMLVLGLKPPDMTDFMTTPSAETPHVRSAS